MKTEKMNEQYTKEHVLLYYDGENSRNEPRLLVNLLKQNLDVCTGSSDSAWNPTDGWSKDGCDELPAKWQVRSAVHAAKYGVENHRRVVGTSMELHLGLILPEAINDSLLLALHFLEGFVVEGQPLELVALVMKSSIQL